MAAVHELDRLLLGEVGVGDQHLVDRVEVALELLERAEVAEAVESATGVRATNPYGSISRLSCSACETAWMFEPEPTSTARRR